MDLALWIAELPAVTGIAPVTAVCWVLLMVGAMITHVRHGSAGFAA